MTKQEIRNKIKELLIELDRLDSLSSIEAIREYCANVEEIDTKTIQEVFKISRVKASRELKKLGYKCKIIKIAGKSTKIYVRDPLAQFEPDSGPRSD